MTYALQFIKLYSLDYYDKNKGKQKKNNFTEQRIQISMRNKMTNLKGSMFSLKKVSLFSFS